MAKKIKCRECDATLSGYVAKVNLQATIERKGQHIEIVAENVCIQCAKNSISCSEQWTYLKS
jgi:hypothetical protein